MTPLPWTTQQMSSQRGKTIVITGANSGLGLETALALAKQEAQLVLAVRDPARGQEAARQILQAHPRAGVKVMKLDLADLKSVHEFASTLQKQQQQLHVLINNAGVMAIPKRSTRDGFEMQFGTNHLGHFALTGLLMPLLLATPGARVVNVSSRAHVIGRMNFDDLHSKKGYSMWGAYGQSKLANLLFTLEFQRQVQQNQAQVLAVSCHPGWAATNLQGVGPQMMRSSFMARLNELANRLFAQGADQGALSQLYAATASDIEGGEYIGPHKDTRGHPEKVRAHRRAYDVQAAQKLWQLSEEMTGVKFNFRAVSPVR